MKNILLIISVLLFALSCDVIDGNVLENEGIPGPVDTTGNDTVEKSFAKKILIEEYTGHKCGNCPGGARTVADLKAQDQYKDKLVVISVHAGSLANWAPPGAPKFTTNFTTAVGDALDQEFGVSLTGIPRGLVNREEISGSKLVLPGTFEQSIQDILDEPNTFVAITGNLSFDENTKTISASISSHFNAIVYEDLNISVYVTEDSVIDWQKNYVNTGDPNYPVGDIEEYVHMHVLRGSMNGTWGDLLNESAGKSIEEGASISKAFTYQLEDGNDPYFCNVIAFIYDTETDAIVQVREWHLKDIID
ncbi:Omp28-related outer membrane protein [Hyphobacterium sp. CCMP332]|nr:Omp28-related outer membrane protein [Hyphobacterium sp. CCMP332]